MLPPTLATARLVLRPPRLVDAHPIFSTYACDPEVTRYLAWHPHESVASTVQYVQSALDDWARAGETLTWILCESGHDDAPIGAITLRTHATYKGELGYVLARRFWGRGLMVEAVAAIIDVGLREDALYRVAGMCDVENVASVRVMEKAGMVHEGTLRRYGVHPNRSPQPRDVHVYAICR